jgi:D-alanyl-D-alanine dipeptidase
VEKLKNIYRLKTIAWALTCLCLVSVCVISSSAEEKKAVSHPSPADSKKMLEKNKNYVDLSIFPHVKILLKYATNDNFMGFNMYGSFNKAFLHKDAAKKFRKAIRLLRKEKPGWSFIVFDALRPRSVQWIMWDKVKDTKDRRYVMDAAKGSVHNYGFALDISLLDEKGKEVDMGTKYDTFSDLAEPQYEEKFLKEGKLTQQQVDNRLILRRVMEQAGFVHIPNEWWHFDGLPREELQKRYQIIE